MSPTHGQKPPRKSSTKGRHIVQRDPLPKGQSCQSCRTRKVRCDAARPACRACLRTARFEGRDLSTVVCRYEPKPAISKKPRQALLPATAEVAAQSGVMDGVAGPSGTYGSTSYLGSTLGELSNNAAYPQPLQEVHFAAFPPPLRTDSFESLAAANSPYIAPVPYTPTPPLSYSSAASPDESVFAHSPPHSISRPPSAYGLYSTAQAPSSASLHLSSMAGVFSGYPLHHHAQMPFAATTQPLIYAQTAPWAGTAYGAAGYAGLSSQKAYAASGVGALYAPPGLPHGSANPQQAVLFPALPHTEPFPPAYPSPVPSTTRTGGATSKKPNLPINLPPPISLVASDSSPVYSSAVSSHPHALRRSVAGSHQALSTPQQASQGDDPTFSLPLQGDSSGMTLGIAARSPFPAFGGAGGAALTPWQTLPSPGGIAWAYPTGAGGSKPAASLGSAVDEWLRGLAA